jgi:hypothetical protein
LATSKKRKPPRISDSDDLSVPPHFPKSFYKLLSQLALEFNISRPQLALKALRNFAKEARKDRSPFHRTLGSQELSERIKEAASASAKDWWATVPRSERQERGRKAAEARWKKNTKSK